MFEKLRKYLYETAKYMLRSYPIIKPYTKRVEHLYAMTPKELTAYQETRFLEVFRRAYDKSSFYSRLYREAGIQKDDIRSLSDITKLPIVTKDMVKRHGREMLTVPSWRVIAGHTSGTTGTPLTIYENWPSILWEQAYVRYYQKLCGFTDGQFAVTLRGNLDKSLLGLKVHAGKTLYLSSYNINLRNAEEYYKRIVAQHPQAIKGYPSSLYALALVFKDKGLKCHIPLAFTSSETLYPHQRKMIEDVFGANVYDHYGTTERTVSLEESLSHDGYFEAPGYAIVEYNDDCLITTSLINDAFPLIRYKTDDRITLKDCTKKTEEGFIDSRNIEKIDGRATTFLIGKDGTPVSDAALTFVFKRDVGIRYAQFVQNEQGRAQLNLVVDDTYDADSENYITDYLERTLGKNNMDVTIRKVSEKELQYTSRGKLQLVINNINGIPMGGGIREILGRSDDYVVCKDGSMVTRIDFVEESQHICACQWIQTTIGAVEVRIVPDDGFTERDKEFVVNATIRRCGERNMDVLAKVCALDELEYTSRGKFRLIVNKTKDYKRLIQNY